MVRRWGTRCQAAPGRIYLRPDIVKTRNQMPDDKIETRSRWDELSSTGPGTRMGNLLRRYWWPIAGTSEMDHAATKPVRLLCENLVLYKDLSGTYGLIDRHCRHRRA